MLEKPLLSIRNLDKKFARDIRSNMHYGLKDIVASTCGFSTDYAKLRRKEFWVLKDINLDLYEGEILGLIGENGSGKTTLLRILSDIYPLDKGEISLRANQRVLSIFALRSGMQSVYTGRENIFLKGALYGLEKEEIEAKLEFIIEFSGLKDQIDSPFGNYSTGMRARLAYAIAIATEPDIFIVDEALAVGDTVFKAKCFDHLQEYVKQPGKSVLFVSNNIRKVMKIATRVLIMDEGRIVHESKDIDEAVVFYIKNCLKGSSEREKNRQLARIRAYDM